MDMTAAEVAAMLRVAAGAVYEHGSKMHMPTVLAMLADGGMFSRNWPGLDALVAAEVRAHMEEMVRAGAEAVAWICEVWVSSNPAVIAQRLRTGVRLAGGYGQDEYLSLEVMTADDYADLLLEIVRTPEGPRLNGVRSPHRRVRATCSAIIDGLPWP